MFKFLGEWSDDEKAKFDGIGGKKLGGKSYVSNPWALTKTDEGIRLETTRRSIKPLIGTVDTVANVIKQYYAG